MDCLIVCRAGQCNEIMAFSLATAYALERVEAPTDLVMKKNKFQVFI